MATNFFFDNYNASGEQELYEDLIVESIKIYGEDMFYIPRKLNNYDPLLGADDNSSYDKAILVELYIKSVDGFTGDGNFMSKFGLQIRDQVVFSIARKTFSQEVVPLISYDRPREGDLIYFPLNKKCFQIKFVNNFEMFYQFGALQTWELTCELFEYSNETMNTGIPEIDSLQKKYSINVLDWAFSDGNNNVITDESGNIVVNENYDYGVIDPASDNIAIQNGSTNFPLGSDGFIDFSETNPFAEGNY
jgi:hypothetical protein